MNNVLSIFESAQLAEASYANLFNVAGNNTITNSEQVKTALIAKGFSTSQAIEATKGVKRGQHRSVFSQQIIIH